jgi:hypothetical protein
MTDSSPKPIELVPIAPPPPEERARRGARFASPGEKRNRYHLPEALVSASPVGFRTRPSFTREQGALALRLLSMSRPSAFVPDPEPVREEELFEECALGLMVARQSTNYRGHRETVVGPQDSAEVASLLRRLTGLDGAVLDGATHTHLVLSRPYRTPFTLLLTLIGHKPVTNLVTVPIRALRKKLLHADDIPTIGYLQHLHLGILADAMERAAVVASADRRRAQVFSAPFCGAARGKNRGVIRRLEKLAGLSAADRAAGWRLALVAQVGQSLPSERIGIPPETCRRIGAALLSLRSERIQPGVTPADNAPDAYQRRQTMEVPDRLVEMCGRAAYNAFAHWTRCDREWAKDHILLERIDVLTPGGKERLREVRKELEAITDRVIRRLPLWADLPTGRAFSKNARRGKKAFALAGQRIYIGGLDQSEMEARHIDWDTAVRALGAVASRSALTAELTGCVEIPDDCDMLAGTCLMAGPVNQNDIGKSFYGVPDLLARAFPHHTPTSLLVWTLKAKTVADPIGNEEQLMNPKQKGALVDLRPGPHEVVSLRVGGHITPMRSRDGKTSTERAFADAGNFVTAADGREIPGNRGEPWPEAWRKAPIWR